MKVQYLVGMFMQEDNFLHIFQILMHHMMFGVVVGIHVMVPQSMLVIMFLFKDIMVLIMQKLLQQIMLIVKLIMVYIMLILHQEV